MQRDRVMSYSLDTITDAILIYDLQLCLLSINPAGATFFGSVAEPIDSMFFDDSFYAQCRQSIEQSQSLCFQQYSDQAKNWFEIRTYPSPDTLVVLIHDVSEQQQTTVALQQLCESLEAPCHKLEDHVLDQVVRLIDTNVKLVSEMSKRIQAEEALSQTNAQFAKVLERITDGICAIAADGEINFVNPKAETLFKKPASELLGRNVWQLYPRSTETEFYRDCQTAIASHETVYGEAFAPQIDRWLSYSLYPNDGLSIYFQDVTHRKQAEIEQARSLRNEQTARLEAQASEKRFEFLSEMSQILANSLDYQTTWAQVLRLIVPELADYCLMQRLKTEQEFCHVAALHRDPQKQSIVDSLCHYYSHIATHPNSLTTQVVRSKQPLLIPECSEMWAEQLTQDAEGVDFYQRLQSRSMILLPLIAKGKLLGTLLLVRSDSEQFYTESDMSFALEVANRAAITLENAQLYEKAQESIRLKDEFLATVSHELKTPLHAIWGWAQMLQRRPSQDPVMQQGIDTIERKAKEFIATVYDLLDMSRVVRGKLQLVTNRVDIAQVLQSVILSHRRATIAKSITLDFHTDEPQKWINCDAERMRQVFWHILSNAIKFTPEQGQIAVSLRTENQTCVVEISDTGQGISPDFLPHIFESFRQEDGSTTRAVGGLGLGLSIVRYLVELHGGTIKIESAGEAQGTLVTIVLPRS
jgi:hypothetical protein